MRRALLVAVIASAAVATVPSVALAQAQAPAGAAPVAGAAGAAVAPLAVVAKPIAQVAIRPARQAQASAVARNESRLSAQVAATVRAVRVDVGQTVKKGDELVRLDSSDLMLSLERARAQREAFRARLALAEAQLARANELRERNFLSADALAQRTAEAEALRAELRSADLLVRTARSELDKTVIRAPFDAAVRARHAQVGELAAPGTPLVTLTEQTGVEVSAAIPAEDALRLRGAGAFVFVGAVRSYEVRLARLAPVVDRATRTREARFVPVGAAPPAGTEGRVTWRDAAPHLPAELAVRRGGRIGVFVADGGRARFVALDGAQEGRPAPVPEGLVGEVIVSGQQALQDGAAIAIGR